MAYIDAKIELSPWKSWRVTGDLLKMEMLMVRVIKLVSCGAMVKVARIRDENKYLYATAAVCTQYE